MSLHRGVFVAGTDTGVGKTLVSVAIVRALVAQGHRIAVMKPIAAGAEATPDGLRNDDAMDLITAANVRAPYELVNPYCLAPPISPHLAARDSGITIDTHLIKERFDELARNADFVVVEGAGGWLAPIGADQTMANVAATLDLPVLMVVGLRLGCLNHSLLTAQAIAASNLKLAGWVANHIEARFARAADNIATLEARLGVAPLDVLPFTADAPKTLELSESAKKRTAEFLPNHTRRGSP